MLLLCKWNGKLHFLVFAHFGLKILPQSNIKALHNLKTKRSGIILDYVSASFHISAIFGF